MKPTLRLYFYEEASQAVSGFPASISVMVAVFSFYHELEMLNSTSPKLWCCDCGLLLLSCASGTSQIVQAFNVHHEVSVLWDNVCNSCWCNLVCFTCVILGFTSRTELGFFSFCIKSISDCFNMFWSYLNARKIKYFTVLRLIASRFFKQAWSAWADCVLTSGCFVIPHIQQHLCNWFWLFQWKLGGMCDFVYQLSNQTSRNGNFLETRCMRRSWHGPIDFS